MKLSEATWTEIRVVYQTTREPLRSIASRFGAGYTTIFQRSINEQWGPRPPLPNAKPRLLVPNPAFVPPVPVGELQEPAEQPTAPPRPIRTKPDTPQDRVTRVFQLIDQQLDNMETLMTTNENLSAEDEARKSRVIGNTLDNMSKATETATDLLQDSGMAHGAESKDAYLKAERLRREIAERLERLNAQWSARSKSE
jgi:hypothetical protein